MNPRDQMQELQNSMDSLEHAFVHLIAISRGLQLRTNHDRKLLKRMLAEIMAIRPEVQPEQVEGNNKSV